MEKFLLIILIVLYFLIKYVLGQYARVYKFINLVDYLINVKVLCKQTPKRVIKYFNI
jgi:hypothetical protein